MSPCEPKKSREAKIHMQASANSEQSEGATQRDVKLPGKLHHEMFIQSLMRCSSHKLLAIILAVVKDLYRERWRDCSATASFFVSAHLSPQAGALGLRLPCRATGHEIKIMKTCWEKNEVFKDVQEDWA